jgi:hypothetical protein
MERATEEAQHDVTVAESILAEEEAHVARINVRRREVIRKHIKHVVFVRVRATDTTAPLPEHPLDLALKRPPVIACLSDPALTVEPELDSMRAVFRAVPLRWLSNSTSWLMLAGRVEPMRGMLGLPTFAPDFVALRNRGLQLSRAFQGAFMRSFVALERFQFFSPQISPAFTFLDLVRHARETLTLGDLLDRAPHRIADAANAELSAMVKVAACMHHAFSEADPELRLGWAERFSEFDGGFDFRRIEGLPGWPRLKPTLRQRLQAESAWLFSRVDANATDAVEMVNDLIRVAMLLSAHAPVRRVISGHIEEDADAVSGKVIRLALPDSAFVNVGMKALIHHQGAAVTCVVENIGHGIAFARVTSAPQGGTRLIKDSRVEFLGGHVG